MTRSRTALALLIPLGLGACTVAPPTGPLVLATPPAGKDLGAFRNEDAQCRNYASAQIGYGSPAEAANRSAVGSAAIGTALGAAAGALLGSAGGAMGTGAAIGAGTGLLAGSAVGAGNAGASGRSLQQHYDTAYAQCMASLGNQLQPPVGYGGGYGYGGYYAPAYGYPAYPYYAPHPPVGVSIGMYGGYGYGRGYRRW
ncbi:hypothetical protein GCM10011504_52660 [Siccirubricoccus deserti]|uniref:Glycine zipper family protein n=1 Tax=Siccirubricoccus deserti TaxID=2013562 RepID=A0A9X0R3F5_9PROT|nr:glycine zipper family protein [Siccirubricoccus deserti]MBC4018754.1 glycine zipper family protein [Siccirubricoccus deserti]GGC68181.1 hypothetical protein GCM10011504_52660 [Siccirubricoccus deserti]